MKMGFRYDEVLDEICLGGETLEEAEKEMEIARSKIPKRTPVSLKSLREAMRKYDKGSNER